MLVGQLIKGSKKFFINKIFDENIRRLYQGKSFSAKNAFFAEKLFAEKMHFLPKKMHFLSKNFLPKKMHFLPKNFCPDEDVRYFRKKFG